MTRIVAPDPGSSPDLGASRRDCISVSGVGATIGEDFPAVAGRHRCRPDDREAVRLGIAAPAPIRHDAGIPGP
jgi:hypothetical protein